MINKKYLKTFIICLLSLFTTSCIPHDPLPNRDIVGKASSLDQLDEALKERMNFYSGKYDIENKDMVGNFLISNYQHPNIEDFTISATSSFTYNFEEPIKRCMFDDDEKLSNYYDIGYLESKFNITFKDNLLEDEYIYANITQKCNNINSSFCIDETLIEREVKLFKTGSGYKIVDLTFEELSSNPDKETLFLVLNIDEFYTHNGFRKKIRTTSVEIIREYYDPIIVDDTVYDAYSGGFLNKDLLYLFSDEYTQNEKYVTFDLQFRAFLEEYIYVYEKFELIA